MLFNNRKHFIKAYLRLLDDGFLLGVCWMYNRTKGFALQNARDAERTTFLYLRQLFNIVFSAYIKSRAHQHCILSVPLMFEYIHIFSFLPTFDSHKSIYNFGTIQ